MIMKYKASKSNRNSPKGRESKFNANTGKSTTPKPPKFKAGNDLNKTVKGPNAKPPKPKNTAKAGNDLGKTVK